MNNINHVRQCRELMQEKANKAGLFVLLEEYTEGKSNTIHIEIKLRDKDGYLVYRSFGDVGKILGFLDGYLYHKQ